MKVLLVFLLVLGDDAFAGVNRELKTNDITEDHAGSTRSGKVRSSTVATSEYDPFTATTDQGTSPEETSSTIDPETSGGTYVREEESSSKGETEWTYAQEEETNEIDGSSSTDLGSTPFIKNLQTTGQTTDLTEETSTTEPDVTLLEATTATPCPDDLRIISLTSTPLDFNVTLKWDPPELYDCVQGYLINLNDKFYTETSNETLELTIDNLNACETYKVDVIIMLVSGKATTGITHEVTTIAPNPFSYSVNNVQFNESENALIVTWKPPIDSVLKCVSSYQVVWWDESTTLVGGSTTSDASYELKIIGCIHYYVMIKPRVSDNLEGVNENGNYTIGPKPTAAPELVVGSLKPDKTAVNLTWTTDTNKENLCPLNEIIVKCVTNEDNVWTIKKEKEEVLKIGDHVPSNYRFPMTIVDLSPFTQYNCSAVIVNSGGNSTLGKFTFKTAEDVPSAPNPIQVEAVSSDGFTVTWTEPKMIPGILTHYNLLIEDKGPNFQTNDDCPQVPSPTSQQFQPDQFSFSFKNALPYHNYSIEVYGTDGAGDGDIARTEITTKAAKPDSVKNPRVQEPIYSQTENYSAIVTLEFEPSCTHGPFNHYSVVYNGVRNGFDDDEGNLTITQNQVNLTLQPERVYSINVSVVTQNFSSTLRLSTPVRTKPGVPILNPDILTPPFSNDTTKAYFELSRNAFNNTNGDIQYYALVLLSKTSDVDYGFWDGTNETWPIFPDNVSQLTPKLWNPFRDGEEVNVFIIGSGQCNEDYCNKPLEEDTEYSLIVRALTSATYKDSPVLNFKTSMLEKVDLALILGLTFGLIAVAILIIFIIILLKRKRKGYFEENAKRFSLSSPAPISCKKFADYYESITNNTNIIKSQYTNIGTFSKEVALSTSYALLPENKRKNRYTNILPYDETRVKLVIDEDDEIGSDYVNASYIKGYTNTVEYIATQGPLESTCKDFWKMVMQENVTVIVMVSQFVEQSKEKCFQYFPNNHEKMSFGDSLEIRCSTQLHFGTYCIRTLQVRKDSEQRNVYHMQFLEWPDFGVPQSTDTMLEFCHQMREKAEAEGGLIVVHCSAGVGRTGTLIALDILLQTINHHKDINIYKTVLDLRKQRINMVQTEKQYMFIHTCVKEYLETSKIQSKEQVQERTYENLDILKSSLKKNLIDTEVESAL